LSERLLTTTTDGKGRLSFLGVSDGCYPEQERL